MNVLVLEDRGSVVFYMVEAIAAEGHAVLHAYGVNDAQSHIESEVMIDCIVADLNMSPDGLSEEEMARTEYGLLTGWVWLEEYVFSVHESMRTRTIIYSEYLSDLRQHIDAERLAGVTLVDKRGSISSAEVVLNRIRAISRLVDGAQ